MLDGRDGDAVDVADGAVADAQAGEQAQADVVLLHGGVLLAKPAICIAKSAIQNYLLYKNLASIHDVQSLLQGS